MNNLPTTHPAEVVEIDPESLEVANTYLQYQDIAKTADDLNISRDMVSRILNKREVRSYIDSVFFNVGFNNRFKMRQLMDTIIQKKLQEMDEADIGSTKDISELLALSHKMTVELLDREIALRKLEKEKDSVKTQTNIQINDNAGSNYGSLIQQLLKGED